MDGDRASTLKSHTETDCQVASQAVSPGIENGVAMLGEGDQAPLHPCIPASVPATPYTPMPQALHGSAEILHFLMIILLQLQQ